MDEANQQAGTESVLQEFDSDTTGKETSDKDVGKESPRKSSGDECNNDIVNLETLNTNGIDKELETHGGDNAVKCDVESTKSVENSFNKNQTSSDGVHSEPKVKPSDENENLQSNSNECSDSNRNNDFFCGFKVTEEELSSICTISVNKDIEKEKDVLPEKEKDMLEKQTSENANRECSKLDLNEANELCESAGATDIINSISTNELIEESNLSNKEEILNPLEEKRSENTTHQESEDVIIPVSPGEELSNIKTKVIPSEKLTNKTDSVCQTNTETVSDNYKEESPNKTSFVSSVKESTIQRESDNCSEDLLLEKSSNSFSEESVIAEPSVCTTKNPVSESASISSTENPMIERATTSFAENPVQKIASTEDPVFEIVSLSLTENSVVDKDSISLKDDLINFTPTTSPIKDLSNEIKLVSPSIETTNDIKASSVSEELGNSNGKHESNLKNIPATDNNFNARCNEMLWISDEDTEKRTVDKEEEVTLHLPTSLDKEESNFSDGVPDKNIEEKSDKSNTSFSESVNKEGVICKENVLFDERSLDNKLPNSELESVEVDRCEENKKQMEIICSESEKENSNEERNKNVEVYDSQGLLNVSNTSFEQEEDNRTENDSNEIMDTELINCNEIEQIDLSENESDSKGETRDEEMIADSLETNCEKDTEDQNAGIGEDLGDAEKNEVLIDEEAVNQPGNSEEETITGDTSNQPSAELGKEKDEEVCIIPDDVMPALSILHNSKGTSMREEEIKALKIMKVSTPEMAKPKTRAQDKKSQMTDSKARPVRNAAKVAESKIKSLVESDRVFDDQNLTGSIEGENFIHENTDESAQMCAQCREVKACKLQVIQNDITQYLCSEQCSTAFKTAQVDAEPAETTLRAYVRKCCQCHSQITIDENRLFWETMDFCNEDCLGKYQLELGSNCANCKKTVPSTSLGKYCVRFGYDIKQFCCALCLEEYKKGLKVCSYCQKDISTGAEGFLAPVGNKGQFKDFCTQSCMEKYERMSSNKPLPEVIEECAVCSNSKAVQVEVELENKTHKLCSEPCFAAFKFVNNITEGQCDMCRKYFDRAKIPTYTLRLLFYDENLHSFCSRTCMNVYILANRKIIPCNWCKVKKYNFDMIKKLGADGELSMMCSLNCLMLYQTSVNAVCSRPIKCDFCKKKFVRQPLYHLTMSDATLRNFCSYICVMSFQGGFPKQKMDVVSGTDQINPPIPTGVPKRLTTKRSQVEPTCVPVISSVQSLASPNGPVSPSGRVQITRAEVNIVPQVSQPLSVSSSPIPAPPPQIYQQIITKPAPAKQMKNKSVLCKPYSHTKGVSCRPHPCMKETQTDQSLNRKFLIPIPVPIYVPAPMHMFATPFPVPVPFPLPIPVPIFIPTTRNSAKGIMKEIKKIQEKIPTDPFEAELLMMAEMVAGDKKQDPTDSESEDGNDGEDNGDGTFSPENVDTSNTFGDDMLQMALKMASELEEPAVDMESVLTSNTITTSAQPAVDPNKSLYASDTDDPDQVNVMAMNRGRKRTVRGSRNSSGGTPSKRGRRTSGSVDVPLLPPPEPVPPRTIEVEKPDANMCLKYTFGVNAWRHWVMQKNAELEKAALTNRKIKLFKPELLQLTADELNFSLCLFVKEVRKPNGTEYAPDTIYYLCLGIQQYLFENGRIDNIFTDSYYEKFTDCLDEVAKKFAALYNDSQFIVTRVEEEHLWESKQLGAHSPHVLLSTLMFFNTKHFNLVTVEEHMQLSFSHIMKHWKRNPNTPGVAKVPGSRNVLLRFYPPQSALEANSRKKKVYEQQENEENPLRCPVKLYEFYLSKCPESVKTRNDVFYLLPERSCVPDSPVWYSTMALGKEPLMKMLHRIKMVKEINIALLTS